MRRTLALVAAAALLASGCGGKARLTKAEYQRRVNQIGQRVSNTLDDTFSSPKLQNPGSLKDAADVIRKGQRDIADGADSLDGLRPPEEIENAHDQLVKGFRDFAGAFGRFAQAIEKGDLAALQSFGQQVSDQTLPAMVEIQRAVDALKAKGYDISKG